MAEAPDKKRVEDEEVRKLLIDQTRKAAKFYRTRMEERYSDVLAVDIEGVLFVVALGVTREKLMELLAEKGLADVETDSGGAT